MNGRALVLASFFAASLAGCAAFDSPPEPAIRGLVDGLLVDAKAPLVVDFGEPVSEDTLNLSVAPYVTDSEGNLADEDDDPATDLEASTFFTRIGGFGDIGGTGAFTDGGASFTLTPAATLPIGPRLVVLVEPGLADVGGVLTVARRRLVFGYDPQLTCTSPSQFPSGYAFFLASVKTPIATQVQLFASIVVDPDTGAFVGQFTNADRDRTPGRCPMPCDESQVCRLLPQPACALPSDPAGTVEEYPDYLPNNGPPTGYSFTAKGCVVDQPDGTTTFVTEPVDVAVTQPDVTLRNARLNASFTKVGGKYSATGSFAADGVLIGGTSSGAASGDLTARTLTNAQAPAGIPDPPAP